MYKKGVILRMLLALAIWAGINIAQQEEMAFNLPNKAEAAELPFIVDKVNHVITVPGPGVNPTDTLNNALKQLSNRPDKATRWTLNLGGGQYIVNKSIVADDLQNTAIVSDKTNPAVLKKAPGFPTEYLFYARFVKNVSLSGVTFYGRTTVYKGPDWGDQGVYFASGNTVQISNCRFYNFGNAAVRITTSEHDPVRGINSFNTTVANNYFENCQQISTTSNDDIHGATFNYTFQGNYFKDLRGAVKFANRIKGAAKLRILNNTIANGSDRGIEVYCYDDVVISGNKISNLPGVAINLDTNEMAPHGFDWGNVVQINNNTITNCGRGIRFSVGKFVDGFKPIARHVAIKSNKLTNINQGYIPAISILNGKIEDLTISQNSLSKIASKIYIKVTEETSNMTNTGNYFEGKLQTQ